MACQPELARSSPAQPSDHPLLGTWTEAPLSDLPDDGRRYEIIDGTDRGERPSLEPFEAIDALGEWLVVHAKSMRNTAQRARCYHKRYERRDGRPEYASRGNARDDLTAMMTTDGHHRYEISPEGVLPVMPPAGYAHAIIATRLIGWLLSAHVPAERIAQVVGLRIPGKSGTLGGRSPDLIVWSTAPADGVWLPVADVLLVVEIISPGSEATDTVTKRTEYAAAGIPQYWTIDQDAAQTVIMYRLDGERYDARATMPLAWVLNTTPAEHDLA